MANKAQIFDNSDFARIAGQFRNYKTDLTLEAKELVIEVIQKTMNGSNSKYSPYKIYSMVYCLTKISKTSVAAWLGRHSEDIHSDSSIRKHLTVVKAVAKALVEADKAGVKLFKKKEEGHDYMEPSQKYQLDKMYNDGKSIQEMMAYMQSLLENQQNDQ